MTEQHIAIQQRLRQARKLSPIDLDNSIGMSPPPTERTSTTTDTTFQPNNLTIQNRKEAPMVPRDSAERASDPLTTERAVHAPPLAYT